MTMVPVEFNEPDPAKPASDLDRAKRLLKSAVKAAETLASDVAELISMRAWEFMGYPNFSDMWEAETGFKCPRQVEVLAVKSLADEGLNTLTGRAASGGKTNGNTVVGIAKMIGLPVHTYPSSDGIVRERSESARNIITQVEHGVPPERVIMSPNSLMVTNIEKYGDKPYEPRFRKRGGQKRMGAAPEDLVNTTFHLPRRDADAIAEIARKADVPNAEIYRQAVAEYLDKLGVSRALSKGEKN